MSAHRRRAIFRSRFGGSAARPESGAPPQLELGFDRRNVAAARDRRSAAHVEHVAAVERYNREDCVSAEKLRDWLETLRAAAERTHGSTLPRPPLLTGEASEQIAATAEETQLVMQALLAGVPVDPAERDEEQHARWLMAHLLEWHRREDKAAWWEFFRLRDLPPEDYEDERSALAGLELVGTVGGTARVPINRYSFPPQDHDIRKKDEVLRPARRRRRSARSSPSTSAAIRSTFNRRATARTSGRSESS